MRSHAVTSHKRGLSQIAVFAGIFHSADVGDSGRLTLEAGPEELQQSMRICEWKAFSRCLKQNAWVAAYFAGLDIGADDAGWTFTFMND